MTMTWMPVRSVKALRRYLAQQRKLFCDYALNINPKQLVREFKAMARNVPKRMRKKTLMLLTFSLEEGEILSREKCGLIPELVLKEASRFASTQGPKGSLEPYDCMQLKSWWAWHDDTANLHCQAIVCMVDPFTGELVHLNVLNDYKDITAMHAVVRAVEPQVGLRCHANNPKPEITKDLISGLCCARLPDNYEKKSELSQMQAKIIAHRGRSAVEEVSGILENTSPAKIKQEALTCGIDPWDRLGEILRQSNACLRAWGRGYSYAHNGHAVSASDLTRHRPHLDVWKYAKLVEEFGRPAGWRIIGVSVDEQKLAAARNNTLEARLPEVHRLLQQRDRESVLFVVERSLVRLPAEEAYIQVMDCERKIRYRSKIQLQSIETKSDELLQWEREGLDVSVWPIPPATLTFSVVHGLTTEGKNQLVADQPPAAILRTGPNEYTVLLAAGNPSQDPTENKAAARLWGFDLARKYGGRTDLVAGDGFGLSCRQLLVT